METGHNNTIDDIVLSQNSDNSLTKVFVKIAFVPVLIFLIFLLGFLGILKFKVEFHSILMMGILLGIALFFVRHNAEYACCVFEDKIEIFRKNLKEFIVDNLLVIGEKKKSSASFDDFVEDFSRDLRNDNYASVATAIFPMFGILGTFISIAVSMPEFSSSSINMLENEISRLLGGVGTAFYVSVYGIFLALWWTFFEKRGLSKFEKLILNHKNSTKKFFWGKNEITNAYMGEILNTNVKLLESCENISNMNFDKNLVNMLQEKINNFKDVLTIEKNSINLSLKELANVNELMEKTTLMQENVFSGYDKMFEKIDSLSSNVVAMQQDFAKQYDRVVEINSIKKNDFEKMLSHINEEFKRFDLLTKEANQQIILSHKDSIDRIKNDIDSLKFKVDDFKEEIRDDVKELNNEFNENIQKIKGDILEIQNSQKEEKITHSMPVIQEKTIENKRIDFDKLDFSSLDDDNTKSATKEEEIDVVRDNEKRLKVEKIEEDFDDIKLDDDVINNLKQSLQDLDRKN